MAKYWFLRVIGGHVVVMLGITNLFDVICILSCVKATTNCCQDQYRDIKTYLHDFRYEVLVTLELPINMPVSFLTTEF